MSVAPQDQLAAWFGSVQIGSHAYLTRTRQKNLLVETIPRLDSVVIKDLGAATPVTLTVRAWCRGGSLTSRQAVEQYMEELEENLSNESPATLTCSGRSYTNCYYYNISFDGKDEKWLYLTVTFYRTS